MEPAITLTSRPPRRGDAQLLWPADRRPARATLRAAGARDALPHLSNIVERWVFQDSETLQRVAREFGGPVSPWLSVLVIVGYCSLLIGGAALLFHRHNMAGS